MPGELFIEEQQQLLQMLYHRMYTRRTSLPCHRNGLLPRPQSARGRLPGHEGPPTTDAAGRYTVTPYP